MILDAPIKGRDDWINNGYYFIIKLAKDIKELNSILLGKQLWQVFEHVLTSKNMNIQNL